MPSSQRYIFGRYNQRPPATNRPRLAGYNASRQRTALEAPESAAESQEDVRQANPVFSTAPPEPPPRLPTIPGSSSWASPQGAPMGPRVDSQVPTEALQQPSSPPMPPPSPAGESPLKMAPEIQQQLEDQNAFASNVYQRHVPGAAPGIDTKTHEMVGELGAPDIAGLGEEPIPASPGEKAGAAMRDAMQRAGLNAASPDIKGILPQLGSIGHVAIQHDLEPRETEALANQRNAAATAAGARANNLDAATDEIPLNALAKRQLQEQQGGLANANAGLANERALTEPQRRAQIAYTEAHQQYADAIRGGGLNLSKAKARLAAAQKSMEQSMLEKPRGRLASLFGAEDTAGAHQAAAKTELDAATAGLANLPNAQPPKAPPAPASAAAPVGAEQKTELEQATDAAYDELENAGGSELDKEQARQFLKEQGLPETRK